MTGRRNFLKGLAAAGTAGLAGCTDLLGGGGDDPTVGAHYVTWLYPSSAYENGMWTNETPFTPVLGNYDIRNEDVVEQHVDWTPGRGWTGTGPPGGGRTPSPTRPSAR